MREVLTQLPKSLTYMHWFFIVATVMHGISLFSTSFIEEEHQTWYFIWTTFCLLSYLKSFYSFVKKKTVLNIICAFSWVILAVMHRVLKKLNQTGDKWASLPDIKLYLHSEDGHMWLLFLFLFGTGMVFCCALSEGCSHSQLVTYGFSLISVIGYRLAKENFQLKYLIFYPTSRGLSEIYIFWVSTSLFVIQTAFNKTPFYLVWLAVNSLILRPHNIILLPTQVLISKRLYKLFNESESTVWNTLAHIWMGNVFYFYQGNGNSLSNIDVAAGFVGIETYNPIYAGIMIAGNTFNSIVLSYLLSPRFDLVFAILRILPLTLYCTALTFQLHHLFIWSVFSPKLIFESSFTFLFLLLMIFNSLLRFV